MDIRQVLYFLFVNFVYQSKSEDEIIIQSKNPLPYFRRNIEETEHISLQSTPDDSNFVSVYIKHFKEIYRDLENSGSTFSNKPDFEEKRDIMDKGLNKFDDELSPIESNFYLNTTAATTYRILYSYKNATFLSLSDKEIINIESLTMVYGVTEKMEPFHLSKHLARPSAVEIPVETLESKEINRATVVNKKLSCVQCDNVATEECNHPDNKRVAPTSCNNDDDLCYSQHTPFGIVERGCFNMNHNFTTYVCSCNLCNFIPISEMPYLFSNKRDWVDNIVELSRNRLLRKSVMKEMTCLRCETNASTRLSNSLDKSCMEGKIGDLPVEECEQDEVCAVRALKKYGYVWRGCVEYPLYNYWWRICDTDLCNSDRIVSVYD